MGKIIKILSLVFVLSLLVTGCGLFDGLDQDTSQTGQPGAEDQVSTQSPMNEYGVLQFEVNTPQTFYLEAKGANQALVRNIETEEEFELTYSADLKLWTTDELVFSQSGTFHLEAEIGNELGETYLRRINTVFVTPEATITDAQTGEDVTNAIATIYVKDPATGEFNVWKGAVVGQNNPLAIPDGFSVILPAGEYYLEVESPDYDMVTSIITEVNSQSIVTAKIKLAKQSLWSKIVGSVSTSDVNNFPLDVAPLPQENLLTIGEEVPAISAKGRDEKYREKLAGLKPLPTVVFVYSDWNTEAQEQMNIYLEVVEALEDDYNLVPLTTMEPDNINVTQLTRGEYDIEFFKPNDQFFDDYFIISLPQFYVLNEKEELLGIITGSRSAEELVQDIEDIIASVE